MAIRSSPRLAMLLLLFHAAVAVVICMTAIPPAARLATLIPLLLSLPYYLARDAFLLLPGSWREISFGQDRVSVVMRDGSAFSGRVTGRTAVTPSFVVLSVRPEGHRLPVCRAILPDALEMDEFRELCVRLRFQ